MIAVLLDGILSWNAYSLSIVLDKAKLMARTSD
jgi:hypothetical protein